MTQYLIRTLTDSTGHPFTHVTKARENETFTVVKAESKEEARCKARNHSLSNKALEESIKEINQRLMMRSGLSKRQRKKWYQKYSNSRAKTKIEKADPLKWLDNFIETGRKDSE